MAGAKPLRDQARATRARAQDARAPARGRARAPGGAHNPAREACAVRTRQQNAINRKRHHDADINRLTLAASDSGPQPRGPWPANMPQPVGRTNPRAKACAADTKQQNAIDRERNHATEIMSLMLVPSPADSGLLAAVGLGGGAKREQFLGSVGRASA